MTTKHTTGPWAVSSDGIMRGKSGESVKFTSPTQLKRGLEMDIDGELLQRTRANYLLIMAAPDLLEACEKAQKAYHKRAPMTHEVGRLLYKAIQKARGDKKPEDARSIEEKTADAIVDAQWKATGTGFHSREAFQKTFKAVMQSNGFKMYDAQYDDGGNCLTCGEAGRCPGSHIEAGAA